MHACIIALCYPIRKISSLHDRQTLTQASITHSHSKGNNFHIKKEMNCKILVTLVPAAQLMTCYYMIFYHVILDLLKNYKLVTQTK